MHLYPHLRTSVRSPSFIAQKASYWYLQTTRISLAIDWDRDTVVLSASCRRSWRLPPPPLPSRPQLSVTCHGDRSREEAAGIERGE